MDLFAPHASGVMQPGMVLQSQMYSPQPVVGNVLPDESVTSTAGGIAVLGSSCISLVFLPQWIFLSFFKLQACSYPITLIKELL